MEGPIRRVRVSWRVIEVCGDGAVTCWRDPEDTTSPFAGRWLLASPSFRAQIEAVALAEGDNEPTDQPEDKRAT